MPRESVIPTCDANVLLYRGRCLQLNHISPKLQKAAKIYCMVLELAAICGTDYTATITTKLLEDATKFACGMEKSDMDVVDTVLDCVNAESSGATYPDTIKPMLCLDKATDRQLDEALLLLKCKLGPHYSQCAPQ